MSDFISLYNKGIKKVRIGELVVSLKKFKELKLNLVRLYENNDYGLEFYLDNKDYSTLIKTRFVILDKFQESDIKKYGYQLIEPFFDVNLSKAVVSLLENGFYDNNIVVDYDSLQIKLKENIFYDLSTGGYMINPDLYNKLVRIQSKMPEGISKTIDEARYDGLADIDLGEKFCHARELFIRPFELICQFPTLNYRVKSYIHNIENIDKFFKVFYDKFVILDAYTGQQTLYFITNNYLNSYTSFMDNYESSNEFRIAKEAWFNNTLSIIKELRKDLITES